MPWVRLSVWRSFLRSHRFRWRSQDAALRRPCRGNVRVAILYDQTYAQTRIRLHSIMILDATCQISYHTNAPIPAIMMLRPRSGYAQWITREEYAFEPHAPVVEYTDNFGNLCQRVLWEPHHHRLRPRRGRRCTDLQLRSAGTQVNESQRRKSMGRILTLTLNIYTADSRACP
jgi:Bacterial transglutaminase-like N-terminal region